MDRQKNVGFVNEPQAELLVLIPDTMFVPVAYKLDDMRGKKKGGSSKFATSPFRVTSSGFKPETSTAVMWCSIQLSYEAFSEGKDTHLFLSPATIFKNY